MTEAHDPDRQKAQARIAEVRARFLGRLDDRLKDLSALALKSNGPDRVEANLAADALRLGLHNLAGSAPTLGLVSIGARAAAIERRVIKARAAEGGIAADVAASIAADIAKIADETD